MKIKDLIKKLEKLDGEKTIGLLAENEICGMFDLNEETISLNTKDGIIKYASELGFCIEEDLNYDFYIN